MRLSTWRFELCRRACQASASIPTSACDGAATFSASPLGPDDALVRQYQAFCAAERIDIAGIELVEDAEGNRYTYDVNANTNYNATLGKQLGIDGMAEVARWLAREVAAEV